LNDRWTRFAFTSRRGLSAGRISTVVRALWRRDSLYEPAWVFIQPACRTGVHCCAPAPRAGECPSGYNEGFSPAFGGVIAGVRCRPGQ
jgi:hypothetical protein